MIRTVMSAQATRNHFENCEYIRDPHEKKN